MLRNRRLPWTAWLTVLVLWTALLVAPGHWFPGSKSGRGGGWGIGEVLHVAAYAALAVAAGWLPATRPARWGVLGLLVAHGAATEFAQTFVPHRDGAWGDATLDAVSVLAGALASWRWWPG
jgi:VanZ family protein